MTEKPSPSKQVNAQIPKGAANTWSIEEVIQFIAANDSSFASTEYSTTFREHVGSNICSTSALLLILFLFSFKGNRWKSIPFVESKHDDEIYGLETWSCFEN